MKRSPYFVPLLSALALIVFSIVVIRTNSADDSGDESLVHRIAIAILYSGLTVGSAFLADVILRKLPGATQHARELKRRRAEWKVPVKVRRAAGKDIKEVGDEHTRYLYWAQRARGRYYRIWKKARARAGHATTSTNGTVPTS